MEIRPLGDAWAISHPTFHYLLQQNAKIIPGMRWSPSDRAWLGSADAVEAVANLLLENKKIQISISGLEKLQLSMALREPMQNIASKSKTGLTVRSYQKDGVVFLLNRGKGGAILSFGLGLGKTMTATLAARALGKHALVVCPASVKGETEEARSWRRELGLWWPKAELFFPKGVKPKIGSPSFAIPVSADVVVINYDILYAWLAAILAWGPYAVALDEGHILSGKDSRRSQACAEVLSHAIYRWVLTGTPLLNYPKDLWGLLSTLCPDRFGGEKGFFKFGMRYCGAHQKEIEAIGKTVWDFSGTSNAAELKRRFEWIMLRKEMSDADVALEIPPKVRTVIWVLGKTQARAGAARLTSKRDLRAALDAASDAKLPGVAGQLVREGYAPGGKVIFCWRKAVVEFVAEAFRNKGLTKVETITGEVPQKTREKRIATSRATEGILIVTIDSCALGIDLTFASQADVIEFVYEPWKLVQAEGRLHRFGQTRSTVFRYFAAAGSADELVIAKIVSKLDSIESVVGSSVEEKGLRAKLAGSDLNEDEILKDIFAEVGT
jgi:SNF2 family DNA or RNA helicase